MNKTRMHARTHIHTRTYTYAHVYAIKDEIIHVYNISFHVPLTYLIKFLSMFYCLLLVCYGRHFGHRPMEAGEALKRAGQRAKPMTLRHDAAAIASSLLPPALLPRGRCTNVNFGVKPYTKHIVAASCE